MVTLSDILDEETIEKLKHAVEANNFPGVSFEDAMTFLLTDGIVPTSGLPVDSMYKLEAWAQRMLEMRRKI